jgi:hypothetical protein
LWEFEARSRLNRLERQLAEGGSRSFDHPSGRTAPDQPEKASADPRLSDETLKPRFDRKSYH